jgi:hypothetical protein
VGDAYNCDDQELQDRAHLGPGLAHSIAAGARRRAWLNRPIGITFTDLDYQALDQLQHDRDEPSSSEEVIAA